MEIIPSKYNGFYFAVYKNKRAIVTKNITPGKTFFSERTNIKNNVEYREIKPSHSKIAAAIVKKISFVPINKNNIVLYLGASHGYTASFISDIIGGNGMIFCVDIAPRVVRDLLFICEERKNMVPLLADANKPETYKNRITQVDIIYQDIAQKNQVEILLKNLQFLKPKGYALIAIKARSIDVTKNPQKIYKETEEQLKEKLKIIDKKELDPMQKDHYFFVCQKK